MTKVRPKKSLGQHFLTDKNIALKISESLQNTNNLPVLELGPGTGILTNYLIKRFDKLCLVEIDRDSVKFLKEKLSTQDADIVEADFLKTDLEEITKLPTCLIGNFPYNISSQILFKVIEHRENIPETVCMLQKEVAERISSPSGNKTYGILSVLLQTWFDIKYLFSVQPNVFYPPPKVQSAVIRLSRNQRTDIGCDDNFYRQLVKTAFNQRRKTLRNALKPMSYNLSNVPADTLNKRAEQLSVTDFIELAQIIDKEA